MNHLEFYEKCTPDAVYFFDIYFRFMKRITSPEFVENNPPLKDKYGHILDCKSIEIFYFLFLFMYVTSDIGKKFKENGVDVLKYFNYPYNVLLEIDESINEVNNNISKDINKRESEYFYKSSLLSKMDTIEEKITLERALYNIVTKSYSCYMSDIKNVFKLTDYFLNNILEEAKLKESGALKTVIMNDPTSFEALVENLKAGKLRPGEVKKIVEEHQNTDELKVDESKEFTYGEELTKKEYKYDPLIGREKELRLLGALLLDEEKSVIIHGKPGVGKTALVEGLSYQIQKGLAHPSLINSRIFSISATEILDGTMLRGQLEEKINKIVKELSNIENSILFIDEMHTLIGAGASIKDTNDVSNMLKPFLGSGKIKVIGATTDSEYLRILSNGAFARRFNGIKLSELTLDEIINVLYGLINRLESSKNIKFNYSEDLKIEILKLIISLSDKKYMTLDQRYNPDFALTVLRNGYNFAFFDRKTELDIDSLIEGVEILDIVTEKGKEYFKEEVIRLTRNKK